MGFPSNIEFVRFHSPLMFFGPPLLALGAFTCHRTVHRWRTATATRTTGVWFVMSLGCLLLGVIFSVPVPFKYLNAWRFQRATRGVVELRIEPLDARGRRPRGPVIVVKSRDTIMDGLRTLSSAPALQRNHEHFVDGYRVQLKIAGHSQFSNRYLYVYRRTSRSNDVCAVVPHVGRRGGLHFGCGEYRSPDFHAWFDKEIKPLIGQRAADRE